MSYQTSRHQMLVALCSIALVGNVRGFNPPAVTPGHRAPEVQQPSASHRVVRPGTRPYPMPAFLPPTLPADPALSATLPEAGSVPMAAQVAEETAWEPQLQGYTQQTQTETAAQGEPMQTAYDSWSFLAAGIFGAVIGVLSTMATRILRQTTASSQQGLELRQNLFSMDVSDHSPYLPGPADTASMYNVSPQLRGSLQGPLVAHHATAVAERMNYFNELAMSEKLNQLNQCRFMDRAEFADGVKALEGKKIVIVGCGAQGLNQGLNMRDSGCDISYALRQSAIDEKRASYVNASENGFTVGNYKDLIPNADLVLNLTPDKQHTSVVNEIMPLMKNGSTLAYSHGFNIVEEGMKVRDDIAVIMVAPKCPGTEVREEYKRGFGVPTLLAVHPANDPRGDGLSLAKAYAAATGGHRAGCLQSSFVSEVKSDLMGEQTILCGMLQTGAILCFDKMVEKGIDAGYASKLIQYGWETQTEALKQGGITGMMDRLDNPSKLKCAQLAEELKVIMQPLYHKHQDDIITGAFSKGMMADWDNGDANLLKWRAATGETAFEKTPAGDMEIKEQEYFDNAILMVAMCKAGVELAFEEMVKVGMTPESAYYESLHETPLIANTIARKKLFEMNRVISDTAEYGCYLFNQACEPLLTDFMKKIDTDVIGTKFNKSGDNGVDNQELVAVNAAIRAHPVEVVGRTLRGYMSDMKKITTGQ